MKITDLIKELTNILAEKGNLEVTTVQKHPGEDDLNFTYGLSESIVAYPDGTVGITGEEQYE